jgi:hypothetical protein
MNALAAASTNANLQLLPAALRELPLARLALGEATVAALTQAGLLTVQDALLQPPDTFAADGAFAAHAKELGDALARALHDGLAQFDGAELTDWPTLRAQLMGPLNDAQRQCFADLVGLDGVLVRPTELARLAGVPLAEIEERADQVRARLQWDKSAGLNWSREVYTVARVTRPKADAETHRHVQYRLKDSEQALVPNVFYHDQLQRSAPVMRTVDGPERFVIDRLVKPVLRTRQRRHEQMYEVKWAGYRQHTDEPRSTLLLDVPHLVQRFERDRAVVWHADKQPDYRC